MSTDNGTACRLLQLGQELDKAFGPIILLLIDHGCDVEADGIARLAIEARNIRTDVVRELVPIKAVRHA